MATLALTSPTGLAPSFVFENEGTHLRVASFSSYLVNDEESLIQKPADPIRNSPSSVISTSSLGRKFAPDGEISVFGAEKYFSGRIDEEKIPLPERTEKQSPKFEAKDNLLRQKTFRSGTPSAASEASWNSRSALLNSHQNVQKQQPRKFFGVLGCNCSCSGKKSIDIDEENRNCRRIVDLSEPLSTDIIIKQPIEMGRNLTTFGRSKSDWSDLRPNEESDCQKVDKMGVGLQREECFSFPASIPVLVNPSVGKPLEEEEKVRMSLEVFGSPVLGKKEFGSHLERRLTMMSLNNGSNSSIGGTAEDDLGSDSSSDLFEIGSLSASGNNPFRSHPPFDDMSSYDPTTCYEPSEASIEWSVVTASQANFSVQTDYEDRRLTRMMDANVLKSTTAMAKTKPGSKKTSMVKEAQRRQSGSLLGCKSSKAVKVAESAYKMPEKPKMEPQKSLRSAPTTPRFPADVRVIDFEKTQAQPALTPRLVSRSDSARVSHAADMFLV